MKPSNSQRSLKVLFVCLGNICRSPLAEAALRDIAARRKLSIMVDSAGTGNWHEGSAPDSRACDVAMRLGGLDIVMLRARQLSIKDFDRFDHIIAMDDSTLARVLAMMPIGSAAQTSLLLDHVAGNEGSSVADPYQGDVADFETCWYQVRSAAEELANRLT